MARFLLDRISSSASADRPASGRGTRPFPMVIGLLCLIMIGGLGAEAARSAELRFRHIDSSRGLSHNSVYSILQDRQGFLWVGTVDGLNRFDGHDFIVHRSDPTDRTTLSNNLVNALHEDRSGTLWVGTADGLNRFDADHSSFQQYLTRVSGAGEGIHLIHLIYEDRDGNLWLGTRGGLLRFDRETGQAQSFLSIPGDPTSLAHAPVIGIQQDSAGRLWVLTADESTVNRALHLMDRETGGFRRWPLPVSWRWVETLLIDGSDRFWLGDAGPVSFDPRSNAFPPPPGDVTNTPEIHQGRDDTIWIGTDRGVLRFDPATERIEPLTEARPSERWLQHIVQAIHEDRSGTLWVGTHAGLFQGDPHAKPFSQLRHWPDDPGSLSADPVSAITEDPSGTLWVGTFGGGLNRLDRDSRRVSRLRHDPGDRNSLIDDVIWSLHCDRQGMLWIGTENGLCSYDPGTGRFANHDLADPAGADHPRITDIAEGPNGELWLVGLTGLQWYDPRTGHTHPYPCTGDSAGPTNPMPSTLLVEGDGAVVWLGLGNLDRLQVESGRFEPFQLTAEDGPNLLGQEVYDLHQDASGAIWLGTGSGLHRFDPGTERFDHYFPRDGLPGSVVYSIVEDERQRLWLGTSQGLSCFDPGLPPGGQFRNFVATDGIGSTEFNRRAVFRNSEGEIFFGGMNGLTTFFPEEIRDNPYIPPVALTRIQVSNREGEATVEPTGLARMLLSYRDYTFSFEFVALSYTNPEQNRYAYRLEGFDRAWVDAGTRRFARYTNVPPGEYVFWARGSNNDGVWNDEGVSLPVVITPPFWQTWWFRLLVLLLVSGALYGAYRYRLARMLELERMRLRIASDLHDDVCSNLSGIAMISEMVQEDAKLDDPARDRLTRIADTSRQTVEDLRDIVWIVDPGHDKVDDLQQKMRTATATLLHGLDHRIDTDDLILSGTVSMDFRRNVFLIYKEILHNIVRHAGASRVRIEFGGRDQDLVLSVADNGVGFDTAAVHRGHGLNSIRRRAEDIGGTLEIDSRTGEGTTVVLTVTIE